MAADLVFAIIANGAFVAGEVVAAGETAVTGLASTGVDLLASMVGLSHQSSLYSHLPCPKYFCISRCP